MALAFHDKHIYKAQTCADLRKTLPQNAVLLDSPRDLVALAWPNTIHHYVGDCIGGLTATLQRLSGNPSYWFEELGKMAIRIEQLKHKDSVKNDFTFNGHGPIKEKQEPIMIKLKSTEDRKRKHLDKSLKIKIIAAENPRRKGTHGFKSWEKIENGMTVAEYLQKGGRTNDLLWEIKKGHIVLN